MLHDLVNIFEATDVVALNFIGSDKIGVGKARQHFRRLLHGRAQLIEKGAGGEAFALVEFRGTVAVIFLATKPCHEPLPHIAIEMQDQVPDAVAGRVRTPPDLFVCQRLHARPQPWPVLLQQLLARKLKEKHSNVLLNVSHENRLPCAMLQERGSGAGLRVRDRTDAFRSGIKMVRVMNTEVLTSFTGRTLDGRFPLLEWLGTVGQRGVFRTEFEGAQTQKAAIWLISADAEDAQGEMEAWAASAGLSHPHLARLFAHGRCAIDGRELLYVVTELPEESLSEVLPARPLTPAETGEMLIPVLDALSYLHGKGLVHGHLQPSNILVIGDQLKLSTDSLQCAGNSINPTAAPQIYDPPETETWPISAAADVWSLGVTLVEALTQHKPAWDKSAGGDPVVPEQMPEPFADIARRCLRQAPALRCTLKEIKSLLAPAAVLPVAEVADAAVAVSQTEPSIPAEPEESTQTEFEFDHALPSRRTLRSVEDAEESGLSKYRTPLLIATAFVVLVLIAALLMRGHKAQPASESETQTASTGEAAGSARTPGSQTPKAKGPVGKGGVAQRVMPDVPAPANRSIRGKVDVRIRVKVDRAGNVSDAQVDSAGRSRYFANLAQDAARKWKFKPARVDGRAASSVWMLRFEFRKDGADVTPVEVTP